MGNINFVVNNKLHWPFNREKSLLLVWSFLIGTSIFLNISFGHGVYGSQFVLILTSSYWGFRQVQLKKYLKLSRLILAAVIITTWSLLVGNVHSSHFPNEMFKILLIIIGTVTLKDLMNNDDPKSIVVVLPIFVALSAIYIWLTGQWDYYDPNLHRFGMLTFGSPNTTAYIIAISLIMLHHHFLIDHPKKYFILIYVLLAILQIALFLTQSRGGILIYLTGLLIINGKKIRLGVLLTTIISVALVLFYLTLLSGAGTGTATHSFVSRLDVVSDVEKDGGTGRFFIWSQLIKSLFESPVRGLFGFGPGAVHIHSTLASSPIESAHSVYVSILHSYGLAGFVILLSIIALLWYRGLQRCCDVGLYKLKIALLFALTVGFGLDSYPLTGQILWFTPLVLAIILVGSIPTRESKIS